eukprot:CAMPEP_0202411634 /NCGR_PEP_ID=MMETSP1128-20130828/22377_1 /ASSEMBLY_ACC=CAM_ASM_000463 /TAXON_ID=3047 /ORGANISM="Dunaliella tertiolecta, Strain CCMP1320" /LENGTH=780 /DNA_ID=CAMNT_0049017371 /DNA_START=116 /DNA_END=2454 /DNA_ORIENTATION=-
MPSALSVLLAIHCKKTESVDLKTPIHKYIALTYSETEAREAEDDLETIQQLRSTIANASTNGMQPGMRDSLAKYCRCLTAIETRFPISKEKGHAQVAFTWYDAFKSSKKHTQYNVHLEKACVMFNLGAVISQQGLACDRTTPDGLITASKHFQEAAGLYAFIQEAEANKVDAPKPQDLSADCLSVMEKLMLAQAQECVYHKAVMDKKSPTVIARLAKQVAVMYEGVTRGFGLSSLSGYFDKSWPAHAAMKGSVFQVEVLSQTAKALQAEDNIAHQVSVLREAFAVLQNTKKLAKAVGADMVDSVSKVQEGVVAALARAEKDNNTIYLQRVPAFGDTGINIQGALLVKNYPPTNLDASTDNLFSSLVPDSSAKSLSKYTDAVDGVTRDARDRLAAATDTARTRLKEMELPEMLEALDPRSSKGTASALPSALLADLEEIQTIGGVTHIQGILAEIGELKRTCEEELVAAANALNADAQADAEARAKYNDQFRATPAPTAAKSYWDRIAQFRASLAQAAASDEGVMDQLAQHQEGFAALAVDAAALKLPRLQAPMVTTGDEDPAVVVASLRRDLEALQALASERSGIEEALNDLKAKDNILPKIMSVNQQAHDSLFASELKKYDVLVADIKRNSEAQTELLARIGNQNKVFREVFDVHGWRAACEAAAAGIREEARTFKGLLDHCSEGLRFYLGMHEVERRCRQEAEDFAFTRSVQRDELKQDIERSKRAEEADQLARRMAMANMHSQQSAPPPAAAYPAPPMTSTPYAPQPSHPYAPPPPP